MGSLLSIGNIFLGPKVNLKTSHTNWVGRIEGKGVLVIDADSFIQNIEYIENFVIEKRVRLSLGGRTLTIENLVYKAAEKSLISLSRYHQRVFMVKNGDLSNFEFNNKDSSIDFSAIQYYSKIEEKAIEKDRFRSSGTSGRKPIANLRKRSSGHDNMIGNFCSMFKLRKTLSLKLLHNSESVERCMGFIRKVHIQFWRKER
jgi:hypothetical protein